MDLLTGPPCVYAGFVIMVLATQPMLDEQSVAYISRCLTANS